MKIKDDWEIEDHVSGLKIKVIKSKLLNRLHIEKIGEGFLKQGLTGHDNRDFWFRKDGSFDGTGSIISETKSLVLKTSSLKN